MLRNWREQDRIDKEISETEELLQQALSRLARLRQQKRVLRDTSEEFIRSGMRGLDEEDGVAEPMSEEQELVGQVHERTEGLTRDHGLSQDPSDQGTKVLRGGTCI